MTRIEDRFFLWFPRAIESDLGVRAEQNGLKCGVGYVLLFGGREIHPAVSSKKKGEKQAKSKKKRGKEAESRKKKEKEEDSRKKRMRIRVRDVGSGQRKEESSGGSLQVKKAKKLKPVALRRRRKSKRERGPELISDPCGVCGRRFKSHKGLCGHMRTHSGRTWRGISPPQRIIVPEKATLLDDTEEKSVLEAARGLVLLQRRPRSVVDDGYRSLEYRKLKMYRCSRCGKEFDSSRGLGGHMAGHAREEKAAAKKTLDVQSLGSASVEKVQYPSSEASSGLSLDLNLARRGDADAALPYW
ncbi:uncharacterized protein LOC144716374 [Wolffia australiana]